MEPIQVIFVHINSIPWHLVVTFTGIAMTLLSKATARQYLKPAAIAPGLAQPRNVLGIGDEVVELKIDTDNHAETVGRGFMTMSRVGAGIAIIGGAWWLLRHYR